MLTSAAFNDSALNDGWQVRDWHFQNGRTKDSWDAWKKEAMPSRLQVLGRVACLKVCGRGGSGCGGMFGKRCFSKPQALQATPSPKTIPSFIEQSRSHSCREQSLVALIQHPAYPIPEGTKSYTLQPQTLITQVINPTKTKQTNML